MRVFKVVFAGVADVQNVGDPKRFNHLSVLGVLPLAQVDPLWEHLVAKAFFGDCSVNVTIRLRPKITTFKN